MVTVTGANPAALWRKSHHLLFRLSHTLITRPLDDTHTRIIPGQLNRRSLQSTNGSRALLFQPCLINMFGKTKDRRRRVFWSRCIISHSSCHCQVLATANFIAANTVRERHVCQFQSPQMLFSVVVDVVDVAVVKVLKSKISFSRAVEMYGFDHSVAAFKMILRVNACAGGMRSRVYPLLKEIVFYYRSSGLDLFGVLYTLLDCTSDDVEASNVVVDALIKVFAANAMLQVAVDVFAQAKGIGLRPGVRSCNFLLKCLAEGNEKEFLLALFENMKSFGPLPNVYTYTIMMNFYCGGHYGHATLDIGKATDVLEEMEMVGINPSVETYGTYIRGLCRDGVIEQAWDYIRDLGRSGYALNSYCYNSVIHGFVDRGEAVKALEVFDEMKSCGVVPDVYSHSILIEGFCQCGIVEESFAFLKQMEKSNLKPSLVTYTSLLKGLCEMGLMKDSLELFRQVATSGIKYDRHAYNILIAGFCLKGDMDSANELLKEMMSNNLAPDSATCMSLLLGLCGVGSFEKAFKFFNLMTEAGVLPNTFTCNHVINGYCNQGQIEEGLQLIGKMKEHGIVPNVFTFSSIVNRLCKEKKSKSALELIPVMLKSNSFPNLVIYSMLIDGFANQRNPRKSFMLYSSMSKRGISPDRVLRTICINMLCATERVKEAYELFQEIPDPDQFSYTSMIAGYCGIKDMEAAWKLFQEMLQKSIVPSVVTYTCLIDGFFNVNCMNKVNKLINDMRRRNICPDEATDYLIGEYRRRGCSDKAYHLLNEVKRKI